MRNVSGQGHPAWLRHAGRKDARLFPDETWLRALYAECFDELIYKVPLS